MKPIATLMRGVFAGTLLCGTLAAVPAIRGSDPPAITRDGQRDFDFHIGTWKTQLRRLSKPLTGSTTWVE